MTIFQGHGTDERATLKDWLSRNLPKRDALLGQRWLRPFAHRLAHPALWHFNRWTVSRGVALGLFVAFLVPFGQVLLAAAIALTVRANLLVAAAATLVSNPFTFPAIYYAAYRVGARLTGAPAGEPAGALGRIAEVSAPTVVGLIVFATLSALAGYGAVQLAWRIQVLRRRAARRVPT